MKQLNTIFISALIMISPYLAFADPPVEKSELEDFREELDTKRSEYAKIGEQEQDQLAKLRMLEEQIALSGQLILKIERASEKLRGEISENESKLDTSNSRLAQKKDILYSRLRYLYKVGNRVEITELLLSENPTAILTAVKNMKSILAYDRHLMESYERLSSDISSSIDLLNSDKAELDMLKSEYEEELMRRKVTLDTRKRLLDKLRKDKDVIGKSMDRLEEDTQRIAGIFEQLQSGVDATIESPPLPGLNGKRGDLIWPVYGEIIRPFGTRKDKRGIKLTNPGIDIKAAYGSKVSAAAAGRVIYSSWLRGYGQFIIIDHGEKYYTLYANLSSVMVDSGDDVKAGQAVGLTGDSGTLEGARLHFELRHGKDQLDPIDWLR